MNCQNLPQRIAQGWTFGPYLTEEITINPGQRRLVSTGIKMAIPPGYEAQIRPRSGLAMKHGVTVLNSPGTIDADYRGDVGVILINLGQDPFSIKSGRSHRPNGNY